MEPFNVDDVPPQRGPRRAETLPVRFAGVDQREVVVEGRTGPNLPRREPRGALRRESTLREENPPEPGHLRRQGSSFRQPIRRKSVTEISDTRANISPIPARWRRPRPRRNRSRHRSNSDNEWDTRQDLYETSEKEEELNVEDEFESDDGTYEEQYYKPIFLREGYEISDESEDESDVNRDAYTFSLSRHGRNPLGRDITLTGSEPSLMTDDKSESQVALGGSKRGTTHHVYSSQYMGEGSIEGLQAAQLTVILDPKKSCPSLFRWIRFEDPEMHFEDFRDGVTHIPRLTDREKTGLANLLGRVRKKYDKYLQTSKMTKVRFMEPGFLQETLSQGDGPKEKSSRARTVTWLCLPYFCLEEYSGVLSTSRPGSHPMRTLLQARFSLVHKERDLQQAIWCLILDDSLLVTCARMPLSALQGNSISVISGPMPEQHKEKSPKLLVSYGGSLLWSFRADECQTWFAFISNFWEFWPRKFRIVYNGTALTADHWPRILNIAKNTSHNIRLTLQMGSGYKAPIRRILNTADHSPVLENTASADLGPFSSDQGGKTQDSPSSSAGDKLGHAQASTSIRNDAEDTSHPHADADSKRGQGTARDQDAPQSSTAQPTTLDIEGFHVFTWLNAGMTDHGTKSLNVNEEQLKEDLEETDYFLSHKTSLSERIAYKECPQISRLAVYNLLEQEGRTITGSAAKEQKKHERKRRIYERRVDIVNAAESVFQFFLPSLFEGPTVMKYWGAIHRLLVASPLDRSSDQPKHTRRRRKVEDDFHPTERDLWGVIDWLEMIVRHSRPFKDLLSHARAVDSSKIEIPDELLKAWLHLIMSLINMTRGSSLWEHQMEICSSLMDKGMKMVVQGLGQNSLLAKSVLMPFEVASLVNFQLLQGVRESLPDISETYFEYLKKLEADIEASPLDRAHQDKITFLKQEVLVIRETLVKQSEAIASILASNQNQSSRNMKEGLVRSPRMTDEDGERIYPRRDSYLTRYEPDPYSTIVTRYTSAPAKEGALYIDKPGQTPQSQLSPTDPGGYRDLLAQDSYDLIQKRIRGFDEINEKATDLKSWNIQKIDSNRDRQESAIYAFTIVTIVFLPLSTVAGFLGMNTYDVRNMKNNQWVFWAAALPLTFIIISLCLIWAGELNNFWTGFANLWRRGSGGRKGGYLPTRDTRIVIERPVRREEEEEEPPMETVIIRDAEELPREKRRDLYGRRNYYV